MEPARLCDRCLGRRLIGAAGEEPQIAAGRTKRQEVGWADVAPSDCPVCEDAFKDLDAWVATAVAALADYEVATFQAGTRFPATCEATEKAVAEAMEMPLGESVRTEANRLLAPALAKALGAEAVTDGRPDVAVTVDTRFWTAELRPNSVYVYGRYTKHSRELPQTHWPCKTCQGLGCYQCNETGAQYESSVEDQIAAVLVPAFAAQSASFHGAGREDIDALMLGSGRPVIRDLNHPRKRTVDLAPLEAQLTGTEEALGVTAQGLRMAAKEEVAQIKDGGYDKAYLAHCIVLEGETDTAAVAAAVATFQGQVLQQRTPERVSHRRADLVRERTVHEVRLESFADATHFTLFVLAESGTYIKEFVSGDEGRTTPSFSERLGVPCKVEFLDVVGILDD